MDFKFFSKNTAGRQYSNNSITVLSKGLVKKLRKAIIALPKIIKSFFLFFAFFTIKNKIYILCKQATGIVFLLPYIYGVELGQISIISLLPARFYNLNKPGDIFYLGAYEPHSERYGKEGVLYLASRRSVDDL